LSSLFILGCFDHENTRTGKARHAVSETADREEPLYPFRARRVKRFFGGVVEESGGSREEVEQIKAIRAWPAGSLR